MIKYFKKLRFRRLLRKAMRSTRRTGIAIGHAWKSVKSITEVNP